MRPSHPRSSALRSRRAARLSPGPAIETLSYRRPPSSRKLAYPFRMRIIAGTLGGRRLQAPAGDDTRPTADRVREALFSILGPPPEGARVLDLCAGAGGLGLEALSRGAASAVFVDADRRAIEALRANIEALGVGATSQVHKGDARTQLRKLAGPFDWVFADPPYA